MNMPIHAAVEPATEPLVIAGRSYRSRLLTGTGKFKDLDETRRATEAAGAEIVTVAIRRTNIGQNPGEPNLLDALPPDRYTLLPNTAGCYSAEDALRTCRLARELLDGHRLVLRPRVDAQPGARQRLRRSLHLGAAARAEGRRQRQLLPPRPLGREPRLRHRHAAPARASGCGCG
jgi:hypothetical protein